MNNELYEYYNASNTIESIKDNESMIMRGIQCMEYNAQNIIHRIKCMERKTYDTMHMKGCILNNA